MRKITRLRNKPEKYFPLGFLFLPVFVFGLLTTSDVLAEKAMTIGPSDQTSKIIMGTSGSKVGIGGDPGGSNLSVNGSFNVLNQFSSGDNGGQAKTITFAAGAGGDSWTWYVNSQTNGSGVGTRTLQLWSYPFDAAGGCCHQVMALNPTTNAVTFTGAVTVGSLTGPLSGTLNAANVSAGTFGSNTGGGGYYFPSNISLSNASGHMLSFDYSSWTQNATVGLEGTFDLALQGHSNIIFRTNHLNVGTGGERMRINNTGVGIYISPSYPLDVNGAINTNGYVYANELYSRDNLYVGYLGWLSNNLNQNVRSDAGPTFANVYTGGWYRSNGRVGMYSETYGSHLYWDSAAYMKLSNNNGLQLNNTTGYDSGIAGYLYHDGTGFGLLNNQGNWMLYSPANNQNVYFPGWGNWISSAATHRGEGTNYIDYSRYVYNNGAYSGSGWIEPSDLGVRYAASAGSTGYASSAGNADTVDGQHFAWSNRNNNPTYLWAADSNGDGYLAWRAGMSVSYADTAGRANRANGNFYIDDNYGNSVVGNYTSTRYQGVFAMGDSYKLPADGSSPGNLYGLAWSHPNAGGVASNLNTHGLLVMENGTFLAAISGSIRARDDVQAPIFYDRNNTGYYVDPNSYSNTWMLNRQRGFDNKEYDYNDTAYYVDPNNDSRFNYLGRNYGYNWTEYDWNDGAYYVDPNNTSRFNVISANNFSGNLSGNAGSADRVNGYGSNPDNSHPGTGLRPFYSWNAGCAYNGGGACYSNGISVGSNPGDQSYGFQIVQNMWDDRLYFRRYNGGWQGWLTVIDSATIGSQSVSYANSSGNSDTVDGQHESHFIPRDTWFGSSAYYGSNGDIYMNWLGWLSNTLNQSVKTDAVPTFSGAITHNAIFLDGISVNTGNSSMIIKNGYADTYAITAGIPNVDQAGFSINKVNGYTYGAGVQSGTSVFVIDSSQRVGIGLVNPSSKLEVSGDIRGGSFVYNSDRNLKYNIATIQTPLEKIMQLRGVTFNWKDTNKPSVGLIAQEVEQVFPELVTGEEGKKGVQYGNLVAPLIEAVKQQQTEISNQQQVIEQLNARLKVLESKRR